MHIPVARTRDARGPSVYPAATSEKTARSAPWDKPNGIHSLLRKGVQSMSGFSYILQMRSKILQLTGHRRSVHCAESRLRMHGCVPKGAQNNEATETSAKSTSTISCNGNGHDDQSGGRDLLKRLPRPSKPPQNVPYDKLRRRRLNTLARWRGDRQTPWRTNARPPSPKKGKGKETTLRLVGA